LYSDVKSNRLNGLLEQKEENWLNARSLSATEMKSEADSLTLMTVLARSDASRVSEAASVGTRVTLADGMEEE
jgi:hypothetical protein